LKNIDSANDAEAFGPDDVSPAETVIDLCRLIINIARQPLPENRRHALTIAKTILEKHGEYHPTATN
jgi:hypothetical protein